MDKSKAFRLRLAQINGAISEQLSEASQVNIGTKKYPLMAKVSKRLSSPIGDSTHHVPNFVVPGDSTGDHIVHHLGGVYHFSGKTGKGMKDKSNRHEFVSDGHGSGTATIWISDKGHITNN